MKLLDLTLDQLEEKRKLAKKYLSSIFYNHETGKAQNGSEYDDALFKKALDKYVKIEKTIYAKRNTTSNNKSN